MADRLCVRACEAGHLKEDTRLTIPTGTIPITRRQSCVCLASPTTAVEFRSHFFPAFFFGPPTGLAGALGCAFSSALLSVIDTTCSTMSSEGELVVIALRGGESACIALNLRTKKAVHVQNRSAEKQSHCIPYSPVLCRSRSKL